MVTKYSTRRRIIGIAGNIGAGKSVVSRILRCNGFPVYDCDMEASRLMETSEELVGSLIRLMGEECYLPGGRLDRKYVASLIFGDPEVRGKVNALVHAEVVRDFLDFSKLHSGCVFVESAIMYSSGLYRVCDEIWVVEASEETRLKRAMSRSKMSEEETLKRMAAQQKELVSLPTEKVKHIYNDDGFALLPVVLRLFNAKAVLEYYDMALK